MLRIISGKLKSRKIEQPPLEITRPTMDRIREAIFSMIQFDIENSIFLDLFSGSGAISLEAVSRGAMKSIAVDNSNDSIKVMEKNISDLNVNNVSIVKNDVINYLNFIGGIQFDFIYIDPPYSFQDYGNVLEIIAKKNILKETGLIFIEKSYDRKIVLPTNLILRKEKKYGKTSILVISNNI